MKLKNSSQRLEGSETKPGFQNKSNSVQATKTKALKRAKESKQNKTTVKQSLQGNVAGTAEGEGLVGPWPHHFFAPPPPPTTFAGRN